MAVGYWTCGWHSLSETIAMQATRVGPFAIEERLPGAAATYRAVHVEQRLVAAVKLLPASFGTTPQMRQAFMDEAATLKMLRHPHLVRCYGGGIDGQQAYLVYEWVSGESLMQLLARRGRLPWEAAVELVRQMALALDYLHERQVYHLGLQPDKILLTAQQQLRILDVRPSRVRGTLFGTVGERSLEAMRYWAPEQFSGSLPAPAKVDLYAVGCLLYEMLTGQTPFCAEEAGALAAMHRQEAVPRVTSVVLDCPVWLDAIVQQLLQKDVSRRMHSANALLRALQEAEQHIARGTSVAEQAAYVDSSLRAAGDVRRAVQLVRPRKRSRARRPAAERTPVWERTWFLIAGLVVLVMVGFWLMKPLSEEQLFRRAEALWHSGDEGSRLRARDDYLRPLLRRFPQGRYAAAAQNYIDQIEMELVESRLRVKLKLGREFKSEAERLLAEAWKFQQVGDLIAAREKYEAMRHLLPENDEHRPYRLIAERELRRLTSSEKLSDRAEFVAKRLADADKLAAEGQLADAMGIWRSVVAEYRDDPTLAAYVEQARQRLQEGNTVDQTSDKKEDSSWEAGSGAPLDNAAHAPGADPAGEPAVVPRP